MDNLIGYYMFRSDMSKNSFLRNHNYIDKIIPNCLEVKEDGSLEENHTEEELELLFKIKGRPSIIPMVQNYNLNSSVSNFIMEHDDIQEKVILNLLKYVKFYGFPGINLDLEGVKIDNKTKYINFVRKMSNIFHKNDCVLGLSIPAKTENNRDSSWSGAYDYNKLSPIVDEIIIMAYDYHWSGGPPGAIAPLNWVRDVIDYAILEIPFEKLYIGIPFYGYDWVLGSDNRAKALSFQQIKELLKITNSTIQWDQDSQTPYFVYRDQLGEHEVWFENGKSISKKLQLVKDFHIRGAAFWRLGLEDEFLWNYIKEVL